MSPVFTVFTPTYNRFHTIHRVFESLQNQTFRDFEWLIVDDGSTDDTKALVESWQKIASFPIRYAWQPNGHKKTAFNHGVRLARGKLFLPADSDDRFLPNALERFYYHWSDIPEGERNNYTGVTGLCQDEQGNIIGDRFPGTWGIDSDSLEIRYRHKIKGEKWGFHTTHILRDFPFPENFPGHVPESVVWSAIAIRFKTRFINEVVRTYFHDAGNQLTSTGDPRQNAAGALYSKTCVLSNEIRWFTHNPRHFILEAARWTRFYLHLGNLPFASRRVFYPSSHFGKFLVVLFIPAGVIWWLIDHRRLQTSGAHSNGARKNI